GAFFRRRHGKTSRCRQAGLRRMENTSKAFSSFLLEAWLGLSPSRAGELSTSRARKLAPVRPCHRRRRRRPPHLPRSQRQLRSSEALTPLWLRRFGRNVARLAAFVLVMAEQAPSFLVRPS